jgi:predicted Rossmann-fold nucleotide-binding protein
MRELHDLESFDAAVRDGALAGCVLQNLDLRGRSLDGVDVEGMITLGCRLADGAVGDLARRGALVFPALPDLPFEPYRQRLYTPDELFAGFDLAEPCSYCDTPDARIYRHYRDTGGSRPPALIQALARRLHDHAITDALEELVVGDRETVAIMGGHGMERGRGDYLQVAAMSRELARRGFLLASGGGPGAMEATHLGAYFAGRPDLELEVAIDLLATAPSYRDERWLAEAFEVRARFDDSRAAPSLGIPTWAYGHEPPNVFASHIAKYFANSVREDGLLAIATGGVIFAPGAAGTIQEIFQDACQNHYGTVGGRVSPMALLGVKYWTETYPVAPLLERLAAGRPYADRIAVSDDAAALVEMIAGASPLVVPFGAEGGWSFCGQFCE